MAHFTGFGRSETFQGSLAYLGPCGVTPGAIAQFLQVCKESLSVFSLWVQLWPLPKLYPKYITLTLTILSFFLILFRVRVHLQLELDHKSDNLLYHTLVLLGQLSQQPCV